MAIYAHIAEVEFSHNFPVDMLRYDECWPEREGNDSAKIEKSFTDPPMSKVVVRVKTRTNSKTPPWTVDRWRSFNAIITHIESFK